MSNAVLVHRLTLDARSDGRKGDSFVTERRGEDVDVVIATCTFGTSLFKENCEDEKMVSTSQHEVKSYTPFSQSQHYL